MQFHVPQFTEQEMKVAGPLSFRQFLMLAIAGGLIMLLYFSLAKTHFFIFLLVSAFVLIIVLALAFFKFGGRSLPITLINSLSFFVRPKVYVWKKKELPPRIVWKKVEENNEIVKLKNLNPELQALGKSRLKSMAMTIDTRK